jgi:pimeloyl-ACP methyl ester carboxylesterase
VRAHLGVERWLVHGRSEGGFAALLYATRYPQAIWGLVLFATAPSYRYLTRQEGLYDPDHPGFRLLNDTLWRFLAEPTDRNYAAHWGVRARILLRARSHAQGQTVPPALQTWPTLDQLFSSRRQEDVAAGAAARFQRFMLDVLSYDVRPDLPAVTAPALIVAGRHDPYCTLDQAEELAGLLPQSALLVLDRAAHAISADGGAAVEQAVKEFLTRHNLGA